MAGTLVVSTAGRVAALRRLSEALSPDDPHPGVDPSENAG
jgi:hypothetical protein